MSTGASAPYSILGEGRIVSVGSATRRTPRSTLCSTVQNGQNAEVGFASIPGDAEIRGRELKCVVFFQYKH